VNLVSWWRLEKLTTILSPVITLTTKNSLKASCPFSPLSATSHSFSLLKLLNSSNYSVTIVTRISEKLSMRQLHLAMTWVNFLSTTPQQFDSAWSSALAFEAFAMLIKTKCWSRRIWQPHSSLNSWYWNCQGSAAAFKECAKSQCKRCSKIVLFGSNVWKQRHISSCSISECLVEYLVIASLFHCWWPCRKEDLTWSFIFHALLVITSSFISSC